MGEKCRQQLLTMSFNENFNTTRKVLEKNWKETYAEFFFTEKRTYILELETFNSWLN